MKNILMIFIIQFNIGLIFADDFIEYDCAHQAAQFGNGKGPTYIHDKCISFVEKNVTHEQLAKNKNLNLEIYGYENVIIVKKTKSHSNGLPLIVTDFLAGNATRLNNVQSLTFDAVKNELVVLDGRTGETLVFDMRLIGNVAPISVIKP